MTPRIGSLCTGYGGLEMGVQAAIGGHAAWVSDVDPGANRILAHRFPDVPNLGDMTKIDWTHVEPVDVLCAGFPCQPVSHAGKGLGDLDERWLWDDLARAVGELRPRVVVLENVRGLLTAGSGRLFGRVLGALAALGYDARWHGLRAAVVGAPHGRWRVFIVATDANGRLNVPSGARADIGPVPDGDGRGATPTLLPTPRSSDTNGAGPHGEGGVDLRTAVGLLPTPRATDGTKGGPNQRGSSGDPMLPSAVQLLGTPTSRDWKDGGPQENVPVNGLPGRQVWALLPTPTGMDAHASGGGYNNVTLTDATVRQTHGPAWGDYAAAIARWEHVLGRPAPAPTMTSGKGNPQLSPRFVEWMMGLPAGWVTDVPGITRNQALKALGNGVVPQQAAAALRTMLAWEVAA